MNSPISHDKRLNGPSFRRGSGRESSHHMTTLPSHCITLTIYREEAGYGMKVSGDNPVYVQSVKEGGAAERAGLHSGDTILKVNGVNVMNRTHLDVVELIKAEAQVVLTVQQNPLPLRERSGSTVVMPSPNLQRQQGCQSRDRVTAPQPVDNEKKRQLDYQRAHTLKLMLENEQRYVESLRSKRAKCNDSGTEAKILQDLHGAERRIQTLQTQLEQEVMEPPPLPNRSRCPTLSPPPPARPQSSSTPTTPYSLPSTPPPLPPRQYLLLGPGDYLSPSTSPGANHHGHTHQRTKSSPDNMTANASLAEASKRLIASESMSELNLAKRSKGGVAWEVDRPTSPSTPPGTPPPPYIINYSTLDDAHYSHIPEEESPPRAETSAISETDHATSPTKNFNFLAQGSPQQPIISMEDEDMSDQEMSQMEDHGPFKRWNKLCKHQAHLAVFLNYVISNSDPSSLLFYLVTDLYKEGSAKEMKKWAYEIHSSFIVPRAPLRLNNVDENVAREIDDVLLKESDKEEILRKIFWKARQKAKDELNEQLADFQAKRTAGLGTLFGPKDVELEESIHDKNKEYKIIEGILVPKLEPFLEDIEKGNVDDRRFTTGAALGTVLSKVFGIRGQHFNSLLERCPTYVSKDKSLKAKLIGKTRKVSTRGHHFNAHQYYLVTYCNHCQNIIWGIGPQGYQCSNCGVNVHRPCVTVLEENCPGPMIKKEKGNDRISKLMDRIRPENARRKPSSLNLNPDRAKKVPEEPEPPEHETGERGGDKGSRASTREKRSESTREGEETQTPQEASEAANNFQEISQHVTKSRNSSATINRSESYKERIHQKRQLRERRKTSDPNLSKSNNDVDVDPRALSYKSNSGSSSNSSLSTRSLESPSQSLEAVGGGAAQPPVQQQWDSDMEAEPDPPDWTTSVPEEVFSQLSPNERKRQEVINELFYSERSHVQALKVLDQIFCRPMKEQQVLPQDQNNLLFSNLEEILTYHSQFNSSMKVKRKEGVVIGNISQLLLDQFDGPTGEAFKKAAATFCAKQQIALETLKERRRKDPKLNNFLSEAETHPYCRRRQLKDIIPTGWQRLTKYPLLFENLAKYTLKDDEEEHARLRIAIDKSKELLNHVDMAVKEAEDEHRLAEIQRRLDKSPFDKIDHPIAQEFKNLDLTKHKLIHEGSLCWRMTNRQKTTEFHVLLLDDAIILLQKQDEKFLLKFNSLALSPIIKVSTVLVRHNAVDKKALFLVNTSHNGAQIYDLVANSISEKRKWFKHISDAAEAYKQREGKHREKRTEGASSEFDTTENRDSRENDETLDVSGDAGLSPHRTYPNADSPLPGVASGVSTPQPGSPQILADKLGSEPPGTPEKTEKPNRPVHLSVGSEATGSEVHVATSTAEATLVDPSEVVVSSRDVLTAEPVLTPLEKLRRKDELVRQILYEKQEIIADILHVPREEFENIADLAGEPAVDKDPSELVLAAVNQAHDLSLVVNDALRLSEEDTVVATSETSAAGGTRSGRIPSVPVHRISGIASALTSHLTQLLNIMTERDEERERLRRELQRSREQLHALHEKYDHNGPSDPVRNPVDKKDDAKTALSPAESSQSTASEVFVDALTEGEETTPEEKPISAQVDK